jgi:two-component system, chemotaxis family, sensor kinase CheA
VMTLVGELVLARNQVLQLTSSEKEQGLLKAAQRLNLITSELQEAVMKTRMQPIGNVWNKLPRVVRDLAAACNKKIRLELEGNETELDKTIIEAIKDPLTHIIRNSIDHGIELPETRIKNGKPAEGILKVRAFHEGGQVNIEVMDDGAGINLEAVRKRAQEKGLLTADRAQNISERELTAMIFQPGFSTATRVSNVSGRGVGMDVVRTNIERIGGMVDIQSVSGNGTTLRMKIPLTLAIIPALIASSAGERFAIPQVSLVELVRLSAEEARSAIEHIQGAPVYRLRGHLLPLLYLDKELQLEPRTEGGPVNIVVLQSDNHQFGLIVDKINDTEEIVVKPLGKLLKGLSCFAGATVMGDGRVALILDIVGLAQHANMVADANSLSTKSLEHEAVADQSTAWLLFLVGRRRMAMPLAQVARLEEFPVSMIEKSGPGEVVQYRNDILPLVRVADLLGEPCCARETVQVIVTVLNNKSVGLVVQEIQDVTEQDLRMESPRQASMLTGSAIIHDHVTDLLDVGSLVSSLQNSRISVPA